MIFNIKIKYLADPRTYQLFRLNKVDYSFDYYKFLQLASEPGMINHNQNFMKHQSIRDALLQATSYRDSAGEQLGSQRADIEYISIDGYQVQSLKFLKFI